MLHNNLGRSWKGDNLKVSGLSKHTEPDGHSTLPKVPLLNT